eukprot:TRINITY_DN16553_c1_g2_i1.p1 TRINITY_DN16553_c1_g2~~TRINITY_DN16553_c1_g2_i1.p1  ORF type:complete len:421 (-),score=59.39 TRINITY_DN16553_c1_g2_i1:8-1270(-)
MPLHCPADLEEPVKSFMDGICSAARQYCELPREEYTAVRKARGCGGYTDRAWGQVMNAAGLNGVKRRVWIDGVQVTRFCLKCEHVVHETPPSSTSSSSSSSSSSSPCTPPVTPPSSVKRDRGGLPSGLTPGDRKKKKEMSPHLFDFEPAHLAFEEDDSDEDTHARACRPSRTEAELRTALKTTQKRAQRAEARIRELEKQLAEARVGLGKTVAGKGARWDLGCRVQACAMGAAGLGLRNIVHLLALQGRLWHGPDFTPPSSKSVSRWLCVGGPLSFVVGVQRAGELAEGKIGSTASQDAASGSRGAHGYCPSALTLNLADPTQPGRVLQLVGDVRIGETGDAATKAKQLDAFRTKCAGLGVPVSHWCLTVDHTGSAIGIGNAAANPCPCVGCSSHKAKNVGVCVCLPLSLMLMNTNHLNT